MASIGGWRVRFRYFAVVRDRLGTSEEDIALPDETSVDAVLILLAERYPELAEQFRHRRLAGPTAFLSGDFSHY